MRILWLYKYMSEYDFDHHLHMSFAKFIATYPGIELKAYGPGLHLSYPLVNLIPYDKDIRLSDIRKSFQFDCIIICTKSRCFYNYNPHKGLAEGCWLPLDFEIYDKCPKIVLEEDYHYETDDKWYQKMKIDLILQRHYSQFLRKEVTPMQFLPFSVDIATFNSWKTESIHQNQIIPLPYSRINKFVFVGNSQADVYKYRRIATEILMKANSVANYSGSTKVNGEYVKALRQYVAAISCGSTCEICAAKNFEIMACGTVLFTNKFTGIDLLFPENAYVSYKNDGSDVLKKAKTILFDAGYATEVNKNARNCIMSKHTHDIRIKELLEIMGKIK